MHPLILLAKLAVEDYIKSGKIIKSPEDLPEEFLKRRAGVFITIKKNDELKGCIGTYLPTKINIAREIIHNAVAAAAEDYRFGEIKKKELPHLSYTVYILNEPEIVKDIKELDAKKYGIIVKTLPITHPNSTDVMFNGHLPAKSGLLLPDLPGVDSVEKQFLIACQKGEIDPAKEKVFIYRFTVEKYE